MTGPPQPAALEIRFRRAAERLFGLHADGHKVADEWPARLMAGELVASGHDVDDAVLAACDLFPDADPDRVRAMVVGSMR